MSKVYKMAFTSKKSILEKMIFMIIFMIYLGPHIIPINKFSFGLVLYWGTRQRQTRTGRTQHHPFVLNQSIVDCGLEHTPSTLVLNACKSCHVIFFTAIVSVKKTMRKHGKKKIGFPCYKFLEFK